MTSDRDFNRIAQTWLAEGPEGPIRSRAGRRRRCRFTSPHSGMPSACRGGSPTMTTPARVAAAAVIGMLALAGGALYALWSCRVSGVGRVRAVTHADSEPDTARPGRWLPLAAGRYVTKPFDPTWPSTFCPDGPGNCPMGVCMGQPGCTAKTGGRRTSASRSPSPEGWEGAPRNSVCVAAAGRFPPARGWSSCGVLRSIRTRVQGHAAARHPSRPHRRRLRQRARCPSDARRHSTVEGVARGNKGKVYGPRRAGSQVPGTTRPPHLWRTRNTGRGSPGSAIDAGSRWHLWIPRRQRDPES